MSSLSELGAYLQRHREDRGWSLDEAEEITHIRRHYIEAMEAGDWDNLPPAVYTRGLLRNYARSLGVSQASIMRMHAKERPHEARLPEPQLISQPLVVAPRFNFELIAAIALLLISAGLIAWVVRSQLPGVLQSARPATNRGAVAAAPVEATPLVTSGPTSTPRPTPEPRREAGVVRADQTETAEADGGGRDSASGSGDASGEGSEGSEASDGSEGSEGSEDSEDGSSDGSSGGSSDGADEGAGEGTGEGADAGSGDSGDEGSASGTAQENPTGDEGDESAAGDKATATPRTRATAGPSATATIRLTGGRLVMDVVATSDAWIQVYTDGEVAYRDFLRKGEKKRWSAKERVGLRTGNAGGTDVKLNGQSLESLGGRGEVVEYEWRMLPSGDVEQRRL